jgi:hypothetical protein
MSNANNMETRQIKGANFNQDGDVIGYFTAVITYFESFSYVLKSWYIEIRDWNVLEGSANLEDIIEATEVEFSNRGKVDVTYNRF